MTQGWQIAIIVIAAIFVGIWIPVSLQLFATLRAGQRFLENIGDRADTTLAEVSNSLNALNQTMVEVSEVAHSAAQMKESIRVVSSIGAAIPPAVIALVRALRESDSEADHSLGGNGASDAQASNARTQGEHA